MSTPNPIQHNIDQYQNAGTHPNTINRMEKARQAVELRKMGYAIPRIAEALGYTTPKACANAIKTLLKQIQDDTAETVDDLRAIQQSQLEQMLQGLWQKAASGDTQAIDRVLKIQERLSALRGLDAPKQQQTMHGVMWIGGDTEQAFVESVRAARERQGTNTTRRDVEVLSVEPGDDPEPDSEPGENTDT